MDKGCEQELRNKLHYEQEMDEASWEKKGWHAKSKRETGGWIMKVLDIKWRLLKLSRDKERDSKNSHFPEASITLILSQELPFFQLPTPLPLWFCMSFFFSQEALSLSSSYCNLLLKPCPHPSPILATN
jgi:hypothetical protein